MEFAFLFEKQREFDKNFAGHEKRDSIKKKIFALLVELGEAANEKPETFKYWSVNPKGSSLKTAEHYAKVYDRELIPIKGDPFLEELVDMLHFTLSIGNELELSELRTNYSALPITVDPVDIQVRFAKETTDLYFKWLSFSGVEDKQRLLETYSNLMGYFLTFSIVAGYDEVSLVDAYLRKNKINYDRQQSGY